jgi:hypothetical protein
LSGLPDTILKGGHQRTKQSLVPIDPVVSEMTSEITWPLETKLWWNGPWVIPFQNCVRQSRPPTKMVAVIKNKKGGEIQQIVISETTGSIGTKLCLVTIPPKFGLKWPSDFRGEYF